MNAHMHHPAHQDMESIARDASLYDWLIDRSRARRPDTIPGHLHADLGLAPRERQRDWSGWRPFG
ncbi:hypothetical protein [Devosia sediminis]|uniref:Uncharacterized protein n=1 Tax=Devosia sediminis TaxID=2798801 RepID=A0A934MN60_9HYPH|nr:hypothetical protein [Devosia sediminis]MBJ3786436.1 hypothetical protein [Devosia sediminis]